MTRRRTHEEIEEIVNTLGYELLDEYTEKHKLRVVIQDKIGYKWDGLFANLIRPDMGIGFFNTSSPYVLENISLWLKVNISDFELSQDNIYEGNDKNLKFFHNIPECQEEFYMRWASIQEGCGCPVCYGRQVGKYNNLAYLRPELVKEWHPDNKLIPEKAAEFSSKKVYWICCKCGYGENKEWLSIISNRTRRGGGGCPACVGRVVTDKNRLSILYPKIADEWDYVKNEDTPNDVSFGSAKLRWWMCPKGHSYCSRIADRPVGQGCEQCSDERKESPIAVQLKKWCKQTFKYVDIEHKMFKNPKTNQWLRCDIYIGEPKSINGVYIEVHGGQHYKFVSRYHITQKRFEDSKERDKIKKEFAYENGTYAEIDLRNIKTIEDAIGKIENIIGEIENDSVPKRSYRKIGYKV